VPTVDEVVQQKIEQVLVEKGVCDKDTAQEIALALLVLEREVFNADIEAMRADIRKQAERQDRLWNHIFAVTPPKSSLWKRLWGSLVKKKGI